VLVTRIYDNSYQLNAESIRGDAGRTFRVKQQPHVLAISYNLSVALQHLRLPQMARTLWVGAICINQDNLDERSEEVSKMGLIYGNARRVVIWLGQESRDSTQAIEALRSIGEDVHIRDTRYGFTCGTKQGSVTHQLEYDHPASRAKVLSWIAIRNLLNRPWFTRLWVFQEIGLASDAVVVIGDESIQWNAFRAAVFWITGEISKPTLLSDIFDSRDLDRIKPLLHRTGGLSSSLYQLLEKTKHTICCDPRDRIYAILSLLHPMDPIATIIPSYSNSVEDLYTEVMLREVKFGRLGFLRICDFHKPRSTLKLPSWVPDLSTPSQLERIYHSDASGGSVAETIHNEAFDTLTVRGRQVCVISHVSAPISHSARLPEVLATCHSWEPPNASTTRYIGGGLLIDAFIITLFFGARDQTGRWHLGNLKEAYNLSVVNGKIDGWSSRYTKHLQSRLPGGALFTAVEGHIGLCPASARPGDRISIALGCTTPLMLRLVSGRKNRYLVGGECFVASLTSCEGLLGPIYDDWTDDIVIVDGRTTRAWIRSTGSQTQLNPRAGPFPPGWRVRYGLNGDESEIDADGNMKSQWFENVETGERCWYDPRLRSQSLRARGVDIQDFLLV
jgi:Heterokaryon incompatibility protein (HET)